MLKTLNNRVPAPSKPTVTASGGQPIDVGWELARRTRIACWAAATLACLLLEARVLDAPHPFAWLNADEFGFGSIAYGVIVEGKPKATCSPDGLFRTDQFFAAHPQLYSYLVVPAWKALGIKRWVMRLPSVLLFVTASTALLAMLLQRRFGTWHFIAAMGLWFLSPWTGLAASSARPEMLSVAALYLSAWFALRPAGPLSLVISGALVGLAVFNHPVYIGPAALPLLLAKSVRGSQVDGLRGLLRLVSPWVAGAAISGLALAGAVVVPHLASWMEQFPAHVKAIEQWTAGRDFGTAGMGVFIQMRHRWSGLGWPFLNWYLGLAVFTFLCLRPTRLGWLGLGLIGAWAIKIESSTPVLMYYCTAVAAGFPLVALLNEESPDLVASPRWVAVVVLAAVLAQVPWNQWRAVRPNAASHAFADRETTWAATFDAAGKFSVVLGPPEGVWPAWKRGIRYISVTPVFALSTEELRTQYSTLARQQAQAEATADGRLIPLSASGLRHEMMASPGR